MCFYLTCVCMCVPNRRFGHVTGFGKTGLIAGLVKIDFFPEKASTKFKYCLRKI